MRSLLVAALLVPFLSFGQKFELSEQVGSSTGLGYSGNTAGFSNQLAVGYHFIKHLSLSAFYEYNVSGVTVHSAGLSPDFTSKYFFVGIEAKEAFQSPVYQSIYTTKFSPSFGWGVHVGSHQRISKKISIVEQVGYCRLNLKKETTAKFFIPAEYFLPDIVSIYAYARIGLSYRL